MSDESDWNARIIDEFRANEGKLGGMFEGADVLLLHHTGAKTGVERVNPLGYQRVGDAYAVFGSNSGKTSHPAWLHNLRVHPRTTAEIGTETIGVLARVAEGDERAAIWERQKANIPQFAEYEGTANRDIPVVILEPVDGS
jgi:deazaflavin-dependent oxidoreductase (nitroreductase family)